MEVPCVEFPNEMQQLLLHNFEMEGEARRNLPFNLTAFF